MPAMEFEDPEEAEAWAAMRAAFADDDSSAGVSFTKAAPGGGGKKAEALSTAAPQTPDGLDGDASGGDDGESDAEAPPPRRPPPGRPGKSAQGRAPARQPYSPPPAKKAKTAPMPGQEDEWLQEQVDRLVGEVQRLANGPFAFRLITSLWLLPLEDQHDVLLGTIGTEGALLESKAERGKRVWALIEDEITARGVEVPPPLPSAVPAARPTMTPRPPSTPPVGRPQPPSTKGASKGKIIPQPPSTKGTSKGKIILRQARPRSRSRSPSI